MRTKGWRWFEGLRGRTVLRLLFFSYEFEKKEEKTEASAAKKEEDCQQTGSLSGMGRERKTD